MQHQVGGPSAPESVDDEAVWVGSKPAQVALVIIDETPHLLSVTALQDSPVPRRLRLAWVAIAARVMGLGAEPWQMSADDYLAAVERLR